MQSRLLIKGLFALSLLVQVSCAGPRIGSEEDIVISQQKTECFGTCPVYKLDIYSNRTVVIYPERFMDLEEAHYAILDKDEYKALTEEFADANFFDFEKSYDSNVSDLPTTYISFRWQGEFKRIKDYTGAPEELKVLERKVHALIDEMDWLPLRSSNQ